jgi:hypothetical protein
VSISTGSVSTTNQAGFSLTKPLNTALTTTNSATLAAGAVLPALTAGTSGVAAATTITPSTTNQANQSWSLTTNTDSDQERRLRALYRFATHTNYRALCSEYPLIVTSVASMQPPPSASMTVSMTVTALDAQFLREPGCVICSRKANMGNINVAYGRRYHCPIPGVRASSFDFYVNPRLQNDWLIASSILDAAPEGATYIGHYADRSLYTVDPEKYRQFILFILEATAQGSSAGQSGKGNSPKTPSSYVGPNFILQPP